MPVAMRRTLAGVLITTSPPNVMVLRSSVPMSGLSATRCATRLSGGRRLVRGPGTLRIDVTGLEATTGSGGNIEYKIGVPSADAFDHLAIILLAPLMADRYSESRTWMCVTAAPASAAPRQASAYLFRRDRQIWRHFWSGQAAGHGARNDDLLLDFAHRVILSSLRAR